MGKKSPHSEFFHRDSFARIVTFTEVNSQTLSGPRGDLWPFMRFAIRQIKK